MDEVEGSWRSEDEKKLVGLLRLSVERDDFTSKVFFFLILIQICTLFFNFA